MATPPAGRKIPQIKINLNVKSGMSDPGECETASPTSSNELIEVDWTAQHASSGRTRPTAVTQQGRPCPTSSVQFCQSVSSNGHPACGSEIPKIKINLNAKSHKNEYWLGGIVGNAKRQAQRAQTNSSRSIGPLSMSHQDAHDRRLGLLARDWAL